MLQYQTRLQSKLIKLIDRRIGNEPFHHRKPGKIRLVQPRFAVP